MRVALSWILPIIITIGLMHVPFLVLLKAIFCATLSVFIAQMTLAAILD